jgi:hypothetical protein
LTGCSKISNVSMAALSSNCMNLSTLKLGKCLVVVNGRRVLSSEVLSLVH